MHSRTSDAAGSFGPPASVAPLAPLRSTARDGLKIAIVGGFGVGKTTLVGAVSEIKPLNTEETMSRAGMGVDDLSVASGKTRTTVAFDFGRITLDDEMVLYLFGAPGQERFWYLWERLFSGTMGAVVLVDTRRIADSWYAIDRLEHVGVPFIVARNNFGPPQHSLAELRDALALPTEVPLVDCDARKRHSAKRVLLTLVDHLIRLSEAEAEARAGATPAAPCGAAVAAVTALMPAAEAGSGSGIGAGIELRPASAVEAVPGPGPVPGPGAGSADGSGSAPGAPTGPGREPGPGSGGGSGSFSPSSSSSSSSSSEFGAGPGPGPGGGAW